MVLPTALLSHSIERRARLHVPAMRMNREYFARAREGLIRLPGVTRVATNVRTASILIEHSGPIDLEAAGEEQELFRIAPETIYPHLSETLHGAADRVDGALTAATQGRVDLLGATAVAFGVLGLRQVLRGDALPAGLTLLWSAVSLLRKVDG